MAIISRLAERKFNLLLQLQYYWVHILLNNSKESISCIILLKEFNQWNWEWNSKNEKNSLESRFFYQNCIFNMLEPCLNPNYFIFFISYLNYLTIQWEWTFGSNSNSANCDMVTAFREYCYFISILF